MRRVKERFDPQRTLQPGPLRRRAVTGLRRHPPARAGPDRRLRALRLLPAHVPDLRAVGRGDGLAARAHRAHEGRPRGAGLLAAAQVDALDNCLGCMACVTACPSGVQYDKLIEDTRAPGRAQRGALRRRAPAPAGDLRALPAPRPAARARPAGGAARRLRPERGPGRSASARAGDAAAGAERGRARRGAAPARGHAGPRPAARPRRLPAGLRPARVLRRRQRGDRGGARRRGLRGACARGARAAAARCSCTRATAARPASSRGGPIAAFEDYDVVVVNAAGCGSAMKDYGHLLRDDPAWGRARRRSPPRSAT